MKLINQSCEVWKQGYTLNEIYDHIARCTRVCYQSEAKEGEESLTFLNRTILRHPDHKDNHLGVAEHGTVYLTIPNIECNELINFYQNNPYSRVTYDIWRTNITTNMRVVLENNRMKDLKFLTRPNEHHEIRTTVSFITNIGISRELNRHRCHSICEESTRYCNYSRDKFDNQLTFIIPNYLNIEPGEYKDAEKFMGLSYLYLNNMKNIEYDYNILIQSGCKPQEARALLPLSLKTQVIHTAFSDDWNEFLRLRSSKRAHPEMVELCSLLKTELCL